MAIGAVAALAGSKGPVAFIIGACLALSSTAIVVEMLSRQGRLNTSAGRASFATLLAQDLAVAPLLLFISIYGAGESGSVVGTLMLALTNAAIALGVIVVAGRVVMRPLFRLVASVGMSDLFVATTLFVIVATGVAAAVAGISMALGAFVAGLLLAETEFRKAIETAINPFKGLLLGLFFFTVGMNIDFRELAREPVWLVGGALGLIAAKAAILIALARLYRLSWPASLEMGLLLGPGGEFAFVGIGIAAGLGLIDAKLSSFTVTLTALTMMLIPALSHLARRLAPIVREDKPLDPELQCRAEWWQRPCHRHRIRPGRTGGLHDARSPSVQVHRRRQRCRGSARAATARTNRLLRRRDKPRVFEKLRPYGSRRRDRDDQ